MNETAVGPGGTTARFTDAQGPAIAGIAETGDPATIGLLTLDTLTHYQFDLTSFSIATPLRQLDSIVFWQLVNNPRNAVNVQIQTSVDGALWNTVGSTTQSSVNYAGPYNRIGFSFTPNEVTNFNFLRVVDSVPSATGVSPAWLEFDGQITAVPEPSTYALLTLAMTAFVFHRLRLSRSA